MRLLFVICLLAAGTILVSFAGKNKLIVTSSAFLNNRMIPSRYSCQGAEVSPPLRVSGIPFRTRSIALIVHDPDAPKAGGMTHWVAWNLGVNGRIPENYKHGTQGLNGAMQPGYKGMCPPDGIHHYHFKVYALDTRLNLSPNTDKAGLERAMTGHILGEGELIGLYTKKK